MTEGTDFTSEEKLMDSKSGDHFEMENNHLKNIGLDTTSENSGLGSGSILGKDSSGGIVVARGTGDGLILRLDGRVDRQVLLTTLLDYVESRKSFFSGQEVTLEWIEARPADGVVAELSDALSAKFQLLVKASRMFERGSKSSSSGSTSKKSNSSKISNSVEETFSSGSQHRLRPAPVSPKISERPPLALGNVSAGSSIGMSSVSSSSSGASLFDGVAALSSPTGNSAALSQSGLSTSGFPQAGSLDKRSLATEALLWDEADTRIIRETLRGGQKIESEHSVVIIGDVNSGAEIVAGGDIFVLGRLRGVAHAGAYDESGGGRKIFALQMQPTQLRIGSVISQGSEEGGRMPEIAKIEGNMIVVEPYGAGTTVKRLFR